MTQVQSQQAKPLAVFKGNLDRMKAQIALALPKHMNADRMTRLAMTAFSTTPALQECSMQSIAGSLMVASQLGLEPNVNGQGYLIPYKGTCSFVPGWKGLVDLVARAGRATVWTGAVFAGDDFDYQLGDAPYCRHKPGDSNGNFTHVYAIGRIKGADMAVIEVWTRAKVERHLQQYNKVGTRHYALASENNFEMYARKVALLQVLKYMPSSVELANAITASHAAENGQGITIDGDVFQVHDPVPDSANQAGATGAAASADPDGVIYMTTEEFDAKKAGWKAAIEGNKKTVNELVAFIETKTPLSPDQKMEIASWKATGAANGEA